MDWWLLVMSLKNIGNCSDYSSLETFSNLKEKFFNPKYNTDIKHSGNLMEHQILYITQIHTIYTFEVL
jgi:hypothetical protein